jgi:hypothetical protein
MNDILTAAHRDDKPVEIPITPKDKESFLKSVLIDAPYEETVSLFDGKLNLTFRALTIDQHEDHLNQVKLDEKAGVSSNDDAYFTKFLGYRMAMSLIKVDGKDWQPEINKEDFKITETQTYVGARAAIFEKWPAFKLSSYIEVFNQFEKKIVKLAQEIQTPGFWKASM